jgi:branched chain amino acid efflux pump
VKLDLVNVLAILAMAIATYATRVSGLFLVRYLRPGPVLQSALNVVPVAVLTAVIAPMLAKGGVADLAAAALTVIAALRLPLLAAVVLGVLAAVGFRALLA